MSNNIEFQPWDSIPASHKRGEGEAREVLGETFLGEPAWLPYMGTPTPTYRRYHVAVDGLIMASLSRFGTEADAEDMAQVYRDINPKRAKVTVSFTDYPDYPTCAEGDHPNDDNPGRPLCRTCEEWMVADHLACPTCGEPMDLSEGRCGECHGGE